MKNDVEKCSYAILNMHKGLLEEVPALNELSSIFNNIKATLKETLTTNGGQRIPEGACHVTLRTWARTVTNTPAHKVNEF